ncbi:MAG: hypothetical protein LBI79_06320 [Nitrososphaerota archaeon]|nr:hypothetical protein [Nitrososphaerota archaeon]
MFLVLVVLAVGLLVWQAPAISSFFEGLSGSDSEYSTLSLVSGISQTYQHNNDTFVFSYKLSSADSSNLLYVTQNVEQSRSFPAVAGATYSDLGLEMKVSSATQELLVLLVKPLPD